MATKVLGRAVLVPQGDWNPSKQYTTLDFVHYSASNGGDGCSYVAKSNNIGVLPGSNGSIWMKITEKGPKGEDGSVSGVVDALDSSDPKKALSARMGNILNNEIETVASISAHIGAIVESNVQIPIDE